MFTSVAIISVASSPGTIAGGMLPYTLSSIVAYSVLSAVTPYAVFSHPGMSLLSGCRCRDGGL